MINCPVTGANLNGPSMQRFTPAHSLEPNQLALLLLCDVCHATMDQLS